MPKKQKIDKQLDKLFKGIHPEEIAVKEKRSPGVERELPPITTPAAIPATDIQPPAPPIQEAPEIQPQHQIETPPPPAPEKPTDPGQTAPLPELRTAPSQPEYKTKPLPDLISSPPDQPRPVKRHTATLIPPDPALLQRLSGISSPSNYMINFQTGPQDWATLRVMDEARNREWTTDEQLLIRQVVDQLSIALENARLFQETLERNEQLAALNKEIRRFQLGIEKSDDAVFVTDPTGVIEYANSGFEKVYGYPPQEVIGKNPRILQSGLISREQYKRFWDTLLGGETVTGEITNRHRDGRLITIAGTNSPILDETGRILGFLAVHHDMTQAKMAEDAINRRNEYLAVSAEIGRLVTSTLDLNSIFSRAVKLISERFGSYHVAIFIVEETGFNAILKEATGDAGVQMATRNYSLPVNSNSLVGKVAAEGRIIVANDVQAHPLHTPNPLLPETRSEVAIPLRIGNRIIGVLDMQATSINEFSEDEVSVLQTLADQVAIAIDNARSYELSQEAVKEMRETDRVKTQFLANMSHELRTPLNSIIGFSRVILKGIDGPVSELQQQDLTAIYNSGQHLLSLINDILDLAKIEAGKMELAFDEVNLADVAASVMATMTGLIKDKPIKLQRVIEPDLPTVRADAIRIRQVLINLLSNAAKFTDEGDIIIAAGLRPAPNGRKEVQVSVTDTGPGISKEDQAKLFQAFSQVDDSPTRKTGGTGLGLSICQHLINMHGGRIWVESELGKGSTFTFSLPLYHEETQAGPVATGKKVVLSIDDDPHVIGLYERYLQPQDYRVIPLTDPAKALEVAKQLKPYAITLDIMMPGIDGWQVLERLKNDPETRSIPVIICSIIEEKDKGYTLGASDYLTKPILEEDLVGALDRLNADGSIREVLVIDDDPNDLRLIGKMLNDDGRYRASFAEGGKSGWDVLTSGNPPHAVILDLFMPEMDGFKILEGLRADEKLRDIPVIVVSGLDLTAEQKEQLMQFGQRLLAKGSFTGRELLEALQRSLERVKK